MTATLSPDQWTDVHRAIGQSQGIIYFGTEDANGDQALSFEQRLKRCNELAAFAVMFGDLEDGTLVHGTIEGYGNPRIGHAWVLMATGEIWEPIRGKVFTPEAFGAEYNAVVEKTYTKEQAVVQTVKSGHYGRWHKSDYR